MIFLTFSDHGIFNFMVFLTFKTYSRKLNFAVSVGYARQVVGWLFACWPKSEEVIGSLLHNLDPQNIVGLLDLIQITESKQHFKQVVHNFIRYGVGS